MTQDCQLQAWCCIFDSTLGIRSSATSSCLVCFVPFNRQWRQRKKFKWKAFLENHKCWWLVNISGHMQVLRTFSNTFLNYPFLVTDKTNLHLWKVPSLGLLGCCEAFSVLKVRVWAQVPKWQSNIRYLFFEHPQTPHHELHMWCMSHRPASHQGRALLLVPARWAAVQGCSLICWAQIRPCSEDVFTLGAVFDGSSRGWGQSSVSAQFLGANSSYQLSAQGSGCCTLHWAALSPGDGAGDFICCEVQLGLTGSFTFVLRPRL